MGSHCFQKRDDPLQRGSPPALAESVLGYGHVEASRPKHHDTSTNNRVQYGWTLTDNKLCVVWDSTLNIEAIRQRIQIFNKGMQVCDRMFNWEMWM